MRIAKKDQLIDHYGVLSEIGDDYIVLQYKKGVFWSVTIRYEDGE